jgi:two-component system nitrogen regulation response regulator GlnG
MSAAVVLAVDDEPQILQLLRLALEDEDLTVVTASTAAEGLAQLDRHQPAVVILDVQLPDQSGLDAFEAFRARDPRLPILFLTGSGTTTTAIQAMSRGAFDYLLKPVAVDDLRRVVRRACEVSRLMRVPAVFAEEPEAGPGADVLIGRCPAMQTACKTVGRVAPTDATVLILGESGTGKELVARAVYQYSRRSGRPFLALNCAAIPDALLESELFGHERGAFTGADRRHVGKFEQCHGGTLFLDEIGDMPLLTQTKLLRVLQEQRFERVGGTETVTTDVRLIAATNLPLEKLVREGRFRQDFYYRINVCTIQLPPLRERDGDLPLLVEHFLRRFGRELGKPVRQVAPEAMARLQAYPWPGNVRELQNVIERALLQSAGPVLTPEDLPEAIRGSGPAPAPAPGGLPDLERLIRERWLAGSTDLYGECLPLLEKPLFREVLRLAEGNLSRAARHLGLNRATLRTRLIALGLLPPRKGGHDPDSA